MNTGTLPVLLTSVFPRSCLAQWKDGKCLGYFRHTVNIYWMNKWVSHKQNRLFLLKSSYSTVYYTLIWTLHIVWFVYISAFLCCELLKNRQGPTHNASLFSHYQHNINLIVIPLVNESWTFSVHIKRNFMWKYTWVGSMFFNVFLFNLRIHSNLELPGKNY